MPQRILAVEMPGNGVRAALAERTWNSLRLAGVFEEQRKDGEADVGAALGRLLARAGTPDIVISALPGEFVVKRLLELPFKDQRRLSQVVPFALEEHLPFPVDDAAVAFTRVGSKGETTLVIAALARKPDLKRHLELLSRVGIDPKTVTLSALAIGALLARSRAGQARSHLVLEVEPTSTSLVLLDADGTPRALRTISAGVVPGGDHSMAPVDTASILGVVRQTLLAHCATSDALDVVIAGSGAAASSFRQEIAATLSLSVRDAGEFDYSFAPDGASPDMSRFAGCVAMLLGELPTAPVEMLNFRQDEFAFRGRVRGDLTPFRTTAILAGAAALFGAVHLALNIGTQLNRLHALDREIGAIAAPALGSTAGADAVAALRSGIIGMNKRLALLGGGAAASGPLNALLRISRDLPKRFPMEVEDIAINGTGIKVSGQADSFATVDQMKRALGHDSYFGAIEVEHAKAASNSKVDFQLDITFADAVGAAE